MVLFVAVFVGPSSWLLLVCACVRVCASWSWSAGRAWWWLVCARAGDDSVREVRLAQVIVAVAVRLCEACRRPFWVGLVLAYGVGVKGAEIGCGGFLWGCQPG